MWNWVTNNADTLKAVGGIVGGVGSAYGAYQQGKMNKKIYNLNLDMYNQQKKRQQQQDQNFNLGFVGANGGGV